MLSGSGTLMALVEVVTAFETVLRMTSSDGRKVSQVRRCSKVSSYSSLARISGIPTISTGTMGAIGATGTGTTGIVSSAGVTSSGVKEALIPRPAAFISSSKELSAACASELIYLVRSREASFSALFFAIVASSIISLRVPRTSAILTTVIGGVVLSDSKVYVGFSSTLSIAIGLSTGM